MNKKQLQSFKFLIAEKDQIMAELRTLEYRVYNPKSARYNAQPGSGHSGPSRAPENAAARHLELEDRYRRQLAEIDRAQVEIEDAIQALRPEQRMVIRYRYIDLLDWFTVCERMGYEWAQTHRIHASALRELEALDIEN